MSYTSNIGGKLIVTAKGNINDFAQEDIIIDTNKTINIKGDEKGLSYNTPETFKNDSENFEVSLSINNKTNTIVPLGILDFENNYENSFFIFDYSLKMTNLDSLNFQILDENGTQIYQMTNLEPIVVTAKRKPKLFMELKAAPPPFDPLKPTKTFDFQKIIDDYLYPDLTHTGNYCIFWDGFDNDEVYDSSRFNDKKLKAKITAQKGGTTKTQEIEFEVSRKEVDWVDVKIDKKTKRIDVTLRVDLQDGGENGVSDWDKIPKKEIIIGKPPITTRTKSFTDLEKLAIDGLNYHWGRNKNHAVAKDIKLNGESYEVYMNTVNTIKNTMDDVDLVYNTNTYWGRSNNPGCVSGGKSFLANLAQYIPYVPLNETIYYNIGYNNFIYKAESHFFLSDDDWRYLDDKTLYKKGNSNIDKEFSETAAHEIGHTILRSYSEGGGGSADYSYEHKGSSGYSNVKPVSEGGVVYPQSGEIDLMKYYNNDPYYKDFDRIVAEEIDVLGLIWLTKISLK